MAGAAMLLWDATCRGPARRTSPPLSASPRRRAATMRGRRIMMLEHVVKADVASLYPSLMRSFRIGPACDRLGVLLEILDRLIDLRLAHKAAARAAAPGSLEANTHDATQAAMKILINAAYGYMGAGSIALFADIYAANEVTKRARAVLTKVIDALRDRGLALIEADTDGVYFAVPSNWDEERERHLV